MGCFKTKVINMGVFGSRSISGSIHDKNKHAFIPSGNPDPYNFRVLEAEQQGSYIILKVNYPDCKNYEGDKILVYKAALKEILNQKNLDPHFTDNEKVLSPIARFTPNADGWRNAVKFVKMLISDPVYNGYR